MAMKFQGATLADVARAAGVTPMTVSRFFNHPEIVSARTRQKVQAAVAKLGYSPNVAARMLMGQSSNSVGLVVPTLTDPYYAAVANSVQQAARGRGCLVWVGTSEGSQEEERRLLDQMSRHHVDGILLVPAVGDRTLQAIPSLPPLVSLDRPVPGGSYDAVLVENFRGSSMATEHLIEHGFRSIVCLAMDDPAGYTAQERIGGYESAMRRHRLRPRVFPSLLSRSSVRTQLARLLKAAAPVQAVFAANNMTTVTVLEALLDEGLRVPEDVALFGFDDFELAAYLRPGISVIRQSPSDVGRHGVLRLFERITEGSPSSGTNLILPVEMVLRGSCGCSVTSPHSADIRSTPMRT